MITTYSELTGDLPISITAPAKGAAPQSTIAAGTGYTGTITWEPTVTGTFAGDTVYTATVELTAKSGYQFASTATASVSGATISEKAVESDGSKLKFKATFPKTAGKEAPTCAAPSGVTATYGESLSAISLTNPTGNTDGKWYWMDDTQKVGNVKDSPITYKAKFVPNDTTNYTTMENINVSVTVNKKTLGSGCPIMIPIEVYYTGSALEPTPQIKTDTYGDDLVLNQDYKITKYENNTNVGTGKIYIEALTNGNYSFTASSYNFTIKAASSSITITGDPGKTYDGSAVTDPTVNKTGSTSTVTYTYYTDSACTTKTSTANGAASEGTAPKNAGSYWVTATVASDTNHGEATSEPKPFTISPKDISGATITLGTTQATYNGAEQGVAISSIMDGSTSLIATQDYTIKSGGKATNVGNNTLIIEGKGNYTGTAQKDWSLVAKEVTITPEAKSKTYGAADPALTYTTNIDSDTALKSKFNDAKTGALARENGTDVGTYAINLGTLSAGPNFNLTLASGTVNFTINQATPVITATTPRQLVKNGVEVDISNWASFNNTDPAAKLTYTLDGTSTGITLSADNKLKAANEASTVTSFNIKVTATATANFTAPTEKVIVVNVVTKSDAGVSITGAPTSKTYGDAEFTLTATKSASAPDGGTWSWNSSNPAILEIVSGADTATPTIKVKKADTTGATLTITYTSSTHYGFANATITVAPKTLTVANLTHSGPITKVYDTNTDAPTGLTVSVKPGSLVGTDTLTVTGTLKYNSANVNEANQITFTPAAITTGNYALAASEVLTITGASITQATPTYTAPTGLTATYGQTLADVNIAATTGWSWMNDAESVGDASATPKTFKAKFTPTDTVNYKTVENIDVSVTVNKITWTNTSASGSAKYGTTGSVDLSSYLAAGGSFGAVTKTDSENVLSGDPVMDGNALKFTFVNEASKAGKTATISVSVTDATNYSDYTITVTVTVNNKTTPTVTAPTAKTGLVYNGADQVLIDAGSTTGGTLQYSLTSGSGYSTELPKAKNAGTYTVYYKVIGNDDYADVAENSISVSVAKRTISVKADNKSMTVNGTLPAFTVSYGNFASGDSEATVIETKANASCAAAGTSTGSFPITVGGTTVLKSGMDTNYQVGTPESGTLTVNPTYSGGGGGSVTTYSVTVGKTENGTISVSPKSAAKGSTVTITVTPDKGYVLEALTALDKDGKELKLTEKDGKYTFTMPAGKVEIKATFMDDNTMLNYFVDVKAGDYFYDAVLWAAQKGITNGINDTEFGPSLSCTRAQIVTFLWRAAGSPEPKGTGSFADVPADSYYAKAVAWAVENGITGGTGDGKFSPDATCTREQAVTFLYRASGSPAVSGGSAFSDVAKNAYYADAVAWAEKNEITGGIGGGLFGSGNDCTRAQIVTLLYRAYQGK